MNIDFKVKVKMPENEEIKAKLRKALYKSMVKMKEIAIRQAPVDLGELRASIQLEPNNMNSDVYYLHDGVSYGACMEYGTRAHWVPIKPLIEWARRHKGDEGFAYAVRAKIAKEGVNAHPFFRPALNEVTEKWLPVYFSDTGLSGNIPRGSWASGDV